MPFKPTSEQQAIIASRDNVVKVQAVAGSGKTSTIVMYSNEHRESSIYLSFNRAIAEEVKAKVGSHVMCKSTHSLAFKTFGLKLKHKLNRPKGRYVNVAGTPKEVTRYFNLAGLGPITATGMGSLVIATVNRFQASADSSLNDSHFAKGAALRLAKNEYVDMEDVKSIVLPAAKSLWAGRSNPNSQILATHDTYLKLFQLSKPNLGFRFVYLDEAQDTTDCVLDIVKNQKDSTVVLVGDDYQAIYGWRGAVNALSKVEAEPLLLSQSFRYGQEIADIATSIIGGAINIKGNNTIESVTGLTGVVDKTKQFAKIYRTNAELLSDAVMMVSEGLNVVAEVDSKDFIKLLQSAESLLDGDLKGVKHDSVVPYEAWDDFVEAGEHDGEIKRVAKVVEAGDTDMYIETLTNLGKDYENANVILTTGHKSKGREFDQVVLANDFPIPTEEKPLAPAEVNLLYVAATRAIEKLEYNHAVGKILGA